MGDRRPRRKGNEWSDWEYLCDDSRKVFGDLSLATIRMSSKYPQVNWEVLVSDSILESTGKQETNSDKGHSSDVSSGSESFTGFVQFENLFTEWSKQQDQSTHYGRSYSQEN